MSNYACFGYAAMALKALGFSDEEISYIVDEMHNAMDVETEKYAELYYLQARWEKADK